MNADIKIRWTAALRSGEYPQTRGALRRTENRQGQPPGFCCLGVLCDLAEKDGIVSPGPSGVPGLAAYWGNSGQPSWMVLPLEVVRWAELPDNQGVVWTDDHSHRQSLSGHNDSGYSFAEIADIIEEHL